MQTSPPAPVTWLASLLPLLGWPTLLLLAWRISSRWEQLKAHASTMQADVVKIKDNHLFHVQESLNGINNTVQKMDENISGLRDDARTYFLASQKK